MGFLDAITWEDIEEAEREGHRVRIESPLGAYEKFNAFNAREKTRHYIEEILKDEGIYDPDTMTIEIWSSSPELGGKKGKIHGWVDFWGGCEIDAYFKIIDKRTGKVIGDGDFMAEGKWDFGRDECLITRPMSIWLDREVAKKLLKMFTK